jgi:hypothetical protein
VVPIKILRPLSLATQVAQADVDVNKKNFFEGSSLYRPGTYSICMNNAVGCGTYTIDPTLHRYKTPEAEEALLSAENPTEFGRAIHAYQDSYSHYKKAGEPDTNEDIFDRHVYNNPTKLCIVANLGCKGSSFDYFDPYNKPTYKEMSAGMDDYILDFVIN